MRQQLIEVSIEQDDNNSAKSDLNHSPSRASSIHGSPRRRASSEYLGKGSSRRRTVSGSHSFSGDKDTPKSYTMPPKQRRAKSEYHSSEQIFSFEDDRGSSKRISRTTSSKLRQAQREQLEGHAVSRMTSLEKPPSPNLMSEDVSSGNVAMRAVMGTHVDATGLHAASRATNQKKLGELSKDNLMSLEASPLRRGGHDKPDGSARRMRRTLSGTSESSFGGATSEAEFELLTEQLARLSDLEKSLSMPTVLSRSEKAVIENAGKKNATLERSGTNRSKLIDAASELKNATGAAVETASGPNTPHTRL